ncbi:Streptomyces sporulation and cell division protein, SsgA [Amycolatopsis xylanica]|uniref:Streptomyces sporulation and cell division protein, SsgA n=1 Tax=Amycolatopsis xylanica TaxID=589385 RepID=A0A1H3CNE6_9PSEU|nr:SsgA family sporulation/cell division regulator [Amycolatopsis xylanica]SDX55637.1 Streptomyces sporulation and cell division protein, SsgA [Amycolatopsis xylanica]
MENMRDVVEATITFGFRTFGARPRPVQADLRYDPADPYAVFIGFHTGRGTVRWMFGRDLLADGLLAPAGEGDVIVRPATHPALVLVELNTPGGSAVLEAPADQLAAFVNRTYEVVAPGEEQACFDFDLELSKLV